MGQQLEQAKATDQTRIEFIQALLNDIKALDYMIDNRLFESGITRIGAEQEICLLNADWRPAQNAEELLQKINDEHYTTELARFNLEINLDPLTLESSCFRDMEASLVDLLRKGRKVADEHRTRFLLTGILPTISKSELVFDYMTQQPRYWAMNETIKASRGSDIELRLRGVDELAVVHDSVLFEACNTSFQLHLQVHPDDFIDRYNWAQAISGPVLSACTNSPLLLGRELWSETRIALFQQSIDTRNSSYALKDRKARVNFGNRWSSGTASDVFKNDIASHKILLAKPIDSNSMDQLRHGQIPKLQALNLNNSTIYRWNRPCYGVGGGKPHLRIENRYIPSGPTVIDEIANFAFWIGLMNGRSEHLNDFTEHMDFREAKANFIKAARYGKESVLKWFGKEYSASDLVCNELLPMAYDGLRKCNVDEKDIHRYLSVIEGRCKGLTGSQWNIRSYRNLKKRMSQDNALIAITQEMYRLHQQNKPVHTWPVMEGRLPDANKSHRVGHIMSTNLFTLNDNDHADLATSIMAWKNIHHLPIENESGELVGLLTWTHMKRQREATNTANEQVADIMTKDVTTVTPETEISEAIRIMKTNEYGCLPIVRDRHLVGIITIHDVLPYDT